MLIVLVNTELSTRELPLLRKFSTDEVATTMSQSHRQIFPTDQITFLEYDFVCA